MDRRWIAVVAAAGLIWLTIAPRIEAQTGGGQGQTGGAGINTTAGAGSLLQQARGYGLDSRFTSGTANYTAGSTGMGQTTAGARGVSSGAFGQTATGTNTGGGNFGRVGGIGGIGGFGGLGGVGGLGGIGGAYGMGRNMFGGTNNQQGTQGNQTIRTKIRLGFVAPTVAAPVATANMNKVIARVLARDDYGNGQVNLTLEGQTVVLRGNVSTAHARDVAERLVLLEPGISAVRNELTVSPDEPTPATGPRANSAGQPQ